MDELVVRVVPVLGGDDDGKIACLVAPNILPYIPQTVHSFPSDLSRFIVRPVQGKGLGMIAQSRIGEGEIIAIEHPALIVPHLPPSAATLYEGTADRLPIARRADLMRMAGAERGVEGIVRENALLIPFEVGSGGYTYGAVYPLLNRCNHSCGPNAAVRWDTPTLTGTLYALRPIEDGEEITWTYVDAFLPRAERMRVLAAQYHFTCTCPWCSSDDSDATRALLRAWHQTRPTYPKWRLDPLLPDTYLFESHHEAMRLIEREGLHALLPLFVEEMALCWWDLGVEEEFRKWAGRLGALVGLGRGKGGEAVERLLGLLDEGKKREGGFGGRGERRRELSAGRTKRDIIEEEDLDLRSFMGFDSDFESDSD